MALMVVGCGSGAASDEDRADFMQQAIIGGEGEFTLNAVVQVPDCTGTLITPQLVLTARHCGTPAGRNVFVGVGAVTGNPEVSASVLSSLASPYCQRPGTPRACAEPDGNPTGEYEHTDLLLLRLNQRITERIAVAPIDIRFDEINPGSSDPADDSFLQDWVGRSVSVAGFGFNECSLETLGPFRKIITKPVLGVDRTALAYTPDPTRDVLVRGSADLLHVPGVGVTRGDSGSGWIVAEAVEPFLSIFATTQGGCSGQGPVLGAPANREWLVGPGGVLNPDHHRIPCDPGSLTATLRGRDAQGRCAVYLGEIDGAPFDRYPDPDGDGIADTEFRDNCPATACRYHEQGSSQCRNPLQYDTDHDGVGDACDNCVSNVFPAQENCNAEAELALGLRPRGDACDPNPCAYVHPRRSALIDQLGETAPGVLVRHEVAFRPVVQQPPLVPRTGTVGFRHCACEQDHSTPEARRSLCERAPYRCLIADGRSFADESRSGWKRMSFPQPRPLNPFATSDTLTFPALFDMLRMVDPGPRWAFLSDLWKFGARDVDPTDFDAFRSEIAQLDGITWAHVPTYDFNGTGSAVPITGQQLDIVNHYVAHDLDPVLDVGGLPGLGGPTCPPNVPIPECFTDLPPARTFSVDLVEPWLQVSVEGRVVGWQRDSVSDMTSTLPSALVDTLTSSSDAQSLVWVSEASELLEARGSTLRGLSVSSATGAPQQLLRLVDGQLTVSRLPVPLTRDQCLTFCAAATSGECPESPSPSDCPLLCDFLSDGGACDAQAAELAACAGHAPAVECNDAGGTDFPGCGPVVDPVGDCLCAQPELQTARFCSAEFVARTAAQGGSSGRRHTFGPTRRSESGPLFALSGRYAELYVLSGAGESARLARHDLAARPHDVYPVPLVGQGVGAPISMTYSVGDDAIYFLDRVGGHEGKGTPRDDGAGALRLMRATRDGALSEQATVRLVPRVLTRLHLTAAPDGMLVLAAASESLDGPVTLALIDPGVPSSFADVDPLDPSKGTLSQPGRPARVVGVRRLPGRGRLLRRAGVVRNELVAVALEARERVGGGRSRVGFRFEEVPRSEFRRTDCVLRETLARCL